VTSGYCPRYRYTLIATLTLANLYYICVDFLPTHTIGESVLPAHFLRVILRRSFGFFIHGIIRSGVRGRSWNYSLDHSFVGVIRCAIFACSLGHSLFHVGHSFVREFVGFIRCVIFVGLARSWGHSFRWESFRWVPLVGVIVGYSFVGWFHVGCLLGIRSRDLTGLLSFCTVERL
jgi:hypothetical protein